MVKHRHVWTDLDPKSLPQRGLAVSRDDAVFLIGEIAREFGAEFSWDEHRGAVAERDGWTLARAEVCWDRRCGYSPPPEPEKPVRRVPKPPRKGVVPMKKIEKMREAPGYWENLEAKVPDAIGRLREALDRVQGA